MVIVVESDPQLLCNMKQVSGFYWEIPVTPAQVEIKTFCMVCDTRDRNFEVCKCAIRS